MVKFVIIDKDGKKLGENRTARIRFLSKSKIKSLPQFPASFKFSTKNCLKYVWPVVVWMLEKYLFMVSSIVSENCVSGGGIWKTMKNKQNYRKLIIFI